MSRPALFAELCAGTAALSLRLEGGRYARPPVSRMGAKTGYGEVILHIMGLAAGDGAEHYLWCEPDDGCRLLLEAYRDRQLALKAAAIIRGWADEDPRALWERLRAEGPAQGVTAREAAKWCIIEGWTSQGRYMGPDRPSSCHGQGWTASITRSGIWTRLSGLPTLPATITADARQAAPPSPPGRVVAYIDPPYQDTTGYGHDLTRAEVVALAMRWADVGADVYISEAEPIDLPGWHHVDITGHRRGQKRTFSKQQREWVTCSARPHWTPPTQVSMW